MGHLRVCLGHFWVNDLNRASHVQPGPGFKTLATSKLLANILRLPNLEVDPPPPQRAPHGDSDRAVTAFGALHLPPLCPLG